MHVWINEHATYLMLRNVDPQCSSSDALSPCSRVPRCCCQVLIAWAELYCAADVVGNEGGGRGVPAVAQGQCKHCSECAKEYEQLWSVIFSRGSCASFQKILLNLLPLFLCHRPAENISTPPMLLHIAIQGSLLGGSFIPNDP